MKKNGLRTWKEIVHQVQMTLEWHQEMAEKNEVTLQNLLNIFRDSDIEIQGGYDLQ